MLPAASRYETVDEPSGAIKSYGQRFEQVAGVPLMTFLGMDDDAAH